jgi:RHS repeat-associated protein
MRYVHQGHLGSTSVITDDTGAAVYEATYDPWGNVSASTGTADTDRLYTGQRFDAATGLYYYNARYYDPTLARFISPDTIVPGVGDPQAWNRYAYVLGNPLRYVDPSGRCFTRHPSGRVEQTNNTWLDCTLTDIQRYADDVGALAFWVNRLRELGGGLDGYLQSDVGAALASDLGMNGYDGMLALLGIFNSAGCAVNGAGSLDCSPLKPTLKQNELVSRAVEKIQQAVTRECGMALAAVGPGAPDDFGGQWERVHL